MIAAAAWRIQVVQLLLKLALVMEVEPDGQIDGLRRICSAEVLRFADPAGGVTADLVGGLPVGICEGKMSACPATMTSVATSPAMIASLRDRFTWSDAPLTALRRV